MAKSSFVVACERGGVPEDTANMVAMFQTIRSTVCALYTYYVAPFSLSPPSPSSLHPGTPSALHSQHRRRTGTSNTSTSSACFPMRTGST